MSGESLCRPGHLVKVGFARCTISALFSHDRDIFAVTAGHAFLKPSGTKVTAFRYGHHIEVGRSRSALNDGHHDVGVFRVSRRDLARSAPDDDVIVGEPLSLDEIAEKVDHISKVYFRFRTPIQAVFLGLTGGNRFTVTAEDMGTEGDSGAPCYFEERGLLRLAGLYRRRTGAQTMQFENPNDGLTKLGFRQDEE